MSIFKTPLLLNGTVSKYRVLVQAMAMPSSEAPSSKDLVTDAVLRGAHPFKTVYIYTPTGTGRPPSSEHANSKAWASAPTGSAVSTADHSLSIEERLAVSQCKTHLNNADAETLTHDSSLSAWIAAWDRAGILASVSTATLGDIGLVQRMLAAQQLSLETIEIKSWPTWGLRAQAEEQRLSLNHHAQHKTKFRGHRVCGVSAMRCNNAGTEASLIDWIRVWHGTSTRNAFLAAVAGVGYCYHPVTISHCEKAAQPKPASYQVSVFAPAFRASPTPAYVLSGYLRTSGQENVYGYHAFTRDKAPSIDAHNWLTGNRLAVTQQVYGSHPFSLIERSTALRLQELGGFHVMGLHVRHESSRPEGGIPASHDVVSLMDSTNGCVVGAFGGCLPLSRRMPGVYPYTWIVDVVAPGEQAEDRLDKPGVYLCRLVSPYERIINNWLLRVGSTSALPMHMHIHSFRNAKCAAEGKHCEKHLLYPAADFAVRLGGAGSSRTYSNFRLPIGSLIGTWLIINGVAHDESHGIDAEGAIERLIIMLNGCLSHPQSDLNFLMHWLVFDALTGTLGQMAYRYQIVSLNSGLSLAPIPLWSVEANEGFCRQTSLDFGYQILAGDNEARSMLSGDSLERLSALAGIRPGVMTRFRESCQLSLLRSAPTVRARLQSEAKRNGDLESQSFRRAKSMVEWISDNALSRPSGESYE